MINLRRFFKNSVSLEMMSNIKVGHQMRWMSSSGAAEPKRRVNDYLQTSSILNLNKKAPNQDIKEKDDKQTNIETKPSDTGRKQQKSRAGKKQKKAVEYKVVIPVRSPASAQAQQSADYGKYLNTLTAALANNDMYAKMQQHQKDFVLSMADTLSKNASYSMEQKQQALQISIDFLAGKPFQYHVKALQGTQQEKSYYKRLGMPVPPVPAASDAEAEKEGSSK